MSVKITNKIKSPTLAMMVEQGIADALANRGAEEWWVGGFEFGGRQAFQVVVVGRGLAWSETFPKSEGGSEIRGFMSYAVKSAIEALGFLKSAGPGLSQPN